MSTSPGAPPSGLIGAPLAGLLLAAVSSVVFGFVLDVLAMFTPIDSPAVLYRDYLRAGGWAWIPAWGTAIGMFAAARRTDRQHLRIGLMVAAALLALLPVVWRPSLPADVAERWPDTTEKKIRASRRWSYRSLETVARLLPLSRDPDLEVRRHAVLALGLNRIVSDIEGDRQAFPSRYQAHPLRDSLRTRLLECLHDPDALVRAEAARALCKAPRTFASQPAAAETLAAMLTRLGASADPGRAAWLAIDAVTTTSHAELRRAARGFAHVTPDTALASLARRNLQESRADDSSVR